MRKKPDIVLIIIAVLVLGIFATGASSAFNEKEVNAVSPLQQGLRIN